MTNYYRKPNKTEVQLLAYLIHEGNLKLESNWSDNLLVKNMNDGGMGSLLLFFKSYHTREREFGKCVSEVTFKDEDGVVVIASLNLDSEGNLFELDIWKVDNSPLLSMPEKLL